MEKEANQLYRRSQMTGQARDEEEEDHCCHSFQKILEKLFNERLDKFIDKCKVLNNSQYGFRKKCVPHTR